MALFHCHFFSQALRLSVSVDVILPESRRLLDGTLLTPPRPYAVLYLLHGLSDDHTIWQRRTSIERYAADYDLAVIMPAGSVPSSWALLWPGPKLMRVGAGGGFSGGTVTVRV